MLLCLNHMLARNIAHESSKTEQYRRVADLALLFMTKFDYPQNHSLSQFIDTKT